MERHFTTHSAAETERLGATLGTAAPSGGLLGLVGELGAGKTCLVRGLAAGLGAEADRVHSPSFVMVTEYPGGRLPLYHVDLYRLETEEIDELSLREVLYGGGVAAVEWFDRLPGARPDELLLLEFRYGADDVRHMRAVASGPRHVDWLVATAGE